MTEYALKFCYQYEPGFNVYILTDLVLYNPEFPVTPEITRYLEKEEQFIEEEDKHQLFFVTQMFTLDEIPTKNFVKVAMYPKEKKETNVVNLIFHPLTRSWEDYSTSEKEEVLKEIVWDQERFIGFKYDIVDVEDMEIEVEV